MDVTKGDYDRKRRAELASFLRTRRERVTPEEVGLPPGVRRRTPGLRREEVAQLAGVGVTWYTWLEQGRPINASTQVLDAVARVLKLGPAELWHLYRLAEVPGVPVSSEGSERTLPDEVLPVLDALDPNPACVYSGKYDLLACNSGYAAMFPYLVGSTGCQRNVLWQLFRHLGSGPLCDWELIPNMVAVARANYARHVGEPEWEDWIVRLSELSGQFAELWESHEIALPVPQIKHFRGLDRPDGEIAMQTSSYAVSDLPDARMVVYIPASAADAAKVAALRERAATRNLRPA